MYTVSLQVAYQHNRYIIMTRAPPFVVKLRSIISDPLYAQAINWDAGGMAVVVDPSVFEALVLGRVFKSTKFKSFVRQMNLHGFKQIKTDDAHVQVFECSLFVRDDPDMVLQNTIERRIVPRSPKKPRATDIETHDSNSDFGCFEDLFVASTMPEWFYGHACDCAFRQATLELCKEDIEKDFPYHSIDLGE